MWYNIHPCYFKIVSKTLQHRVALSDWYRLIGGRGLKVKKEVSPYLAQCQWEKLKEEPQERVESEKLGKCWEWEPEVTGRNIGRTGIHRSWGQGKCWHGVFHRIGDGGSGWSHLDFKGQSKTPSWHVAYTSHWPAVWPWAGQSHSLGLSSFLYKMKELDQVMVKAHVCLSHFHFSFNSLWLFWNQGDECPWWGILPEGRLFPPQMPAFP